MSPARPRKEPLGAISPGEKEQRMHPGFIGWWKGRGHGWDHEGHGHHHGCGEHASLHEAGCGPRGRHWRGHHEAHSAPDFDGEGGGFGVRRPLRFLAWKLELEEEQIGKLAQILDELKTERAQAAVDNRRAIGAFADAVSGGEFDEAKAREAGDSRVKSAEKVRDAVVGALGKIHAILDAEQRGKLAYLLRTGHLSI
jgi:Spy/CpxP family protein refolding chaperone